MAAERFFVNSHNTAVGFFNQVCSLSGRSSRFLQPAFRRMPTPCARLSFARTPSRRCTLHHMNDSTLATALFSFMLAIECSKLLRTERYGAGQSKVK
jgi:hypothetical protein